jgi:hypothetical protein
MSRNRPILVLALLATCASTVLASAQVTSSQTETSNQITATTSPVAYVYVSSTVNRANQINGYAAASNGSLTAIPGSPFLYNFSTMAVNGNGFSESQLARALTAVKSSTRSLSVPTAR